MSTDIFRVFKACFFCKHKKSPLYSERLHCVESGAYSNTFIYYHPECLTNVLKNPEKYLDFIDQAIQIQYFIIRDDQRRQEKIQAAQNKIQRARSLYNQFRQDDSETSISSGSDLRLVGGTLTYSMIQQQVIEQGEFRSSDFLPTVIDDVTTCLTHKEIYEEIQKLPNPTQDGKMNRFNLLKKKADPS